MSADVRRGSVKRQSDIMREARKSRQEEQEEERKRKASYYRRVTGNNHRARIPSPLPLRVAKTGRNHLNKEFTPSFPLG
jgi:hypothetical protein